MMEKKRVLITICGRAGSKGFKNKNLKIFNGHPLAYYSLSAAELFLKDRPDVEADLCVNTDSEPLIEIITEKYPEVTVLRRPEELCGDVVPKMAVYQYSIQQMEKLTGRPYEYLIDLDITSPMRRTGDVAGAFDKKCARPDLDLVLSVTPGRRNPYMNMAQAEGDHLKLVIENRNTARQQTPPVFDINASIYVFERAFLVTNTSHFLWDGRCGGFEMFDTGIIDIDSEEDFLLMEAIARYLYETYPEFGSIQKNIRE